MKLFKDHILLKPDYEKTIGGIIIPEGMKPMNLKQFKAKVLVIGPDVWDINIGDTVLYRDYGTKIKYKGEECLLVVSDVVLAKVEE